MYGPFLSSIGGGQALTPPKRHSLGKPLPYQQADTPQADPEVCCHFTPPNFLAIKSIHKLHHHLLMIPVTLYNFINKKLGGDYRVLPHLSMGYPRLPGSYLCITTSSATGVPHFAPHTKIQN